MERGRVGEITVHDVRGWMMQTVALENIIGVCTLTLVYTLVVLYSLVIHYIHEARLSAPCDPPVAEREGMQIPTAGQKLAWGLGDWLGRAGW